MYDEAGINVTLQAVSAIIRDSFNKLATQGSQIRDPQSGDTVPHT